MLAGLKVPETERFPPTDKSFVTVALFKVELPAFNVPRDDVPVTPNVPPTVALFVTPKLDSVEFEALSVPSVEVPVTPRVPETVSFPVKANVPAVMFVFAMPEFSVIELFPPPIVVDLAPLIVPHASVLDKVVAPVTPSVVPTVAAPETPRLAKVEAPVTPRVPETVSFPVKANVPAVTFVFAEPEFKVIMLFPFPIVVACVPFIMPDTANVADKDRLV